MSNLLDKASVILTPTAYDNGTTLCVKPSDGSGDFQFSRNSAATRVNAQGLVENVQILSSNLVQNGDFSEEGAEEVSNGSFTNGSTDWNLGTGWSIGENKAISDGVSINSNLSTLSAFYSGSLSVKMTITVTDYVSGILKIFLSTTNFTEITSNGDYTFYTTADRTDGKLYLKSVNFIGSVTNISVKEVGMDWDLNGWEISENKATCDASGGSALTILQQGILTSGKTYKITYTILDYVQGLLRFRSSPVSGDYTSGNGEHTVYIVAQNATFGLQGLNGFIGSITNLSIIEITTDTNLPRINYEGFSYDGSGNIIPNSGCGSWLFEPQTTQLLPYSEDFSQWTGIINLSIGLNEGVSPSGEVNANLLSLGVDVSVTRHRLYLLYNFVLGNEYTFSVFAKKDEQDWFQLMYGAAFDTQSYANFDLANGVVGNVGTSTDANIVDYGNGWYRCSITCTATATISSTYEILTTNNTNSGRYPSYQSTTNTNVCFLWGGQLEEQSYATSYIPSNGSQVTRNQDVCTNGGSLATINSTEGVLYAEIARSEEQNLYRLLGIDDGTSNNYVKMGFENSRGAFWIRAVINGVTSISSDNALTSNPNEFYKIAIRYQSGNSAIYINGTSVLTTTTTFSSGNFTALDFNHWNNSLNFFGKTKCVAVWKEALSDSELQSLTTI